MRFYLVDRILEYKPWEFAVGIKNITLVDDLIDKSKNNENGMLSKHFVCESLLQTCAWLIVHSSEKTRRPVVLSFKTIKYYEVAKVGDCLTLKVKITTIDEDNALVDGIAYIEDKKIMEFKDCLVSLLNTQFLEDSSDTDNMLSLLFRED